MSQELFYQAIAPILAPVKLVYADQNAPRPGKPYATFKLTSVIPPRFAVEGLPDGGGIVDVTEHATFSLEVMTFGKDAHRIAILLASKLKYPSQVQRIHELGVSIASIGQVLSVPVFFGQQSEEQASVEISGYAIVAGQDDVGLVEEVKVTGTVLQNFGDVDGLTETFTIDAP